jgi:hypothetical protein
MEGLWFSVNYYESLGDIYTKYSFLNLKEDVVIDLIDDECYRFLQSKLIKKPKDIGYFSYDVKYDKTGHKVTILADNIICALWFIGIFPTDNQKVFDENRFENQKFIYTFDKKSCKLKKKLKNSRKK